jgi:thioredoxin-like negative regulator of GroEL
MAPIVHGLEAEYSGKIKFTYLDIDDPANREAMRDLGYIGRPHFYLVDEDGNILQQWLGYVAEEDLKEALNGVID